MKSVIFIFLLTSSLSVYSQSYTYGNIGEKSPLSYQHLTAFEFSDFYITIENKRDGQYTATFKDRFGKKKPIFLKLKYSDTHKGYYRKQYGPYWYIYDIEGEKDIITFASNTKLNRMSKGFTGTILVQFDLGFYVLYECRY